MTGWILSAVYLVGAVLVGCRTWKEFDITEAIERETDDMMIGAHVLMGGMLVLCVGLIWPALLIIGGPILLVMKASGAAIKGGRK